MTTPYASTSWNPTSQIYTITLAHDKPSTAEFTLYEKAIVDALGMQSRGVLVDLTTWRRLPVMKLLKHVKLMKRCKPQIQQHVSKAAVVKFPANNTISTMLTALFAIHQPDCETQIFNSVGEATTWLEI
jgi:hypothetical protein